MPLDGTYRTPNPPSRVCLFYHKGVMEGTPMTAIVSAVDTGDRGVLNLLVYTSGGSPRPMKRVRHTGDPFLEARPDQRQYGVWDYLPQDQPKRKTDAGRT